MSVRPFRDIKRRNTKVINVGKVKIGGDNPISVQSMTNTLTTDVKATIKQINDITFVEQFYGSGSGIDFSRSLYGSLRLEGDEMDNPISYSFYIGDFAMINDIKKNDDKTFTIKGLAYKDNSSDENKINGELFTTINLTLTLFETGRVLLYLEETDDW